MSKKIVIEVPEELKALGEAMQAMVDRVVAANRAAVGGRAVDYAPLEQAVITAPVTEDDVTGGYDW